MGREIIAGAPGGVPDGWASAANLTRVQLYLEARVSGLPVDPRWLPAWEGFHPEVRRRIERVLRRHGLTEPDLSDCMQDIWEKILAGLKRFRYDPARASFETWLERVATNGVRDLIRRRRRERVFAFGALGLDSDYELAAIPVAPPEDVEDSNYGELIAAIERLRASLSPENNYILRARLVDRVRVSEIARRLGLLPGGVSTRLTRLKRELRKEIERARKRR